jgi:uncharacterized membrane protein YfcA
LLADLFSASNTDLLIAALLFIGAVLYTSVGHAGSSVYIAIMSLFGLAAVVIKPTALVLNIFVASFTSFRFIRAKLFDLKLFIPLAVGAIPMSFLGGSINLSTQNYKVVVGILLVVAGFMFIFQTKQQAGAQVKPPKFLLALLVGGSIGFLAGLTGTGGGIFLSPIALLFNWTTVKQASGTSALFILVNSVFGLLGHASSVSFLPSTLPLFVGAVLLGAIIGTRLGITRFSNQGVKKALGAVLIIAGLKLALGL